MSVGARTALDLVFAGAGGRTVMTRRRHRWPLLVGRMFADQDGPGVGTVIVQNAAGTVIPGDDTRQRIEVRDGGAAVVRGQGATMVSGTPGGTGAVEDTQVRVDSTSRLLLDTSPRILTARASYRQLVQACVEPGGCAVLVDAMVLHPDLTRAEFGRYESSVRISAPNGTLLALDAQVLDSLPGFIDAPTAFGTVYVVGAGFDTALTSVSQDLETLSVLAGDRRVYVAVTDLPNDAGWAVRVAASDGGTLRTVIASATAMVEAATRVGASTPVPLR
ncbi:MAG: urease accessory protein UreD [Mycobacterium sp.]